MIWKQPKKLMSNLTSFKDSKENLLMICKKKDMKFGYTEDK